MSVTAATDRRKDAARRLPPVAFGDHCPARPNRQGLRPFIEECAAGSFVRYGRTAPPTESFPGTCGTALGRMSQGSKAKPDLRLAILHW
jgi:hypothetical protein